MRLVVDTVLVPPSGPRHSFPQQQGVLATEGSQLCPIQVALDWRKLQISLLPKGNPHPIICWCADTKDCPLHHLNWEATEGPSFRVPHNIGRSCCCNCIAVQIPPQPNSTFIVPSDIDPEIIHKRMKIPMSQSLFPREPDLQWLVWKWSYKSDSQMDFGVESLGKRRPLLVGGV